MKKKLGDTVLFTNQNVQGAVKQVSRAYVEHPKYPMTNRKAHHQALFTAAANFRRTFAALLDHSWQGQPYGINSLAHFMKLVTMNHGDSFPGYILQPKDIRRAIPQPWPLATGSIVNGVRCVGVSVHDECSYISLRFPEVHGRLTKGEFCSLLIQANPQLQDGDLLTFVELSFDGFSTEDIPSAAWFPVVDRYKIDVNATGSTQQDVVCTENNLFRMYKQVEPDAPIMVMTPNSDHRVPGGFGIIHSRLSPNGKYYMRNNAQMVLAPEVAAEYDTDEYRQMCIQSYLNPDVLSSDWYLNQLR